MSKLDIRHNDKPLTFKALWLQDQYRKIRLDPEFDDMSKEEITNYLLKIYDSRRVIQGRFYNNATQSNEIMSQEQFINKYLNEPLVLSGYACLYKNQDNSINISSAALENLGEMRKINKKKMEASEHGSDQYIYYRILQLTYKVLMNSYYGILGEKNSVFYNPFVQNSITMTGQDLITTLIISMESFLRNNIPFDDTDDVLTFINAVKQEDRKFSIMDFLDEGIGRIDLEVYLYGQGRPGVHLDQDVIHNVISKLDLETLNRCYYKCQFLELIKKNSWFKDKLNHILQYEYAEQPDPEIADEVQDFRDKIIDFTFNDMLFEDRYKRAMKDKRKAIITIDTDSVFSNVNPHVEEITNLLGLDNSNKIQQGSIVNLLINITTEALRLTLLSLTTNMGLIDDAKPIINVKQEFLYKRIMLTQNKKNYAGLITAELGHLLEHPVLDVKGLPVLKKTSVPKALRKQFTEIVENDILKADTIDIKKVVDKYDSLEAMIEQSLRERKTEYLLPKNLEVIDSYKTPSQIEGIRGTLVWNACEPENQIIPPEKINLLKLNCTNPEDPRLKELEAKDPVRYNAIMRTVFNYGVTEQKIDISRFGFSCIAIPKGIDEIPEWLLPFIDYKNMVNVNMSPSYILLESLGVWCDEVKSVKYKSNIISI